MNAEPRTGESVLSHRGMVYPRHLDHRGHLNIRHDVAKFDLAAGHLFERIGMTSDYCRENDRGMAAVEMDGRYLKELRAGAPLGVRSGPLNGDEKSPCPVQEMRLAEAIAARARAPDRASGGVR